MSLTENYNSSRQAGIDEIVQLMLVVPYVTTGDGSQWIEEDNEPGGISERQVSRLNPILGGTPTFGSADAITIYQAESWKCVNKKLKSQWGYEMVDGDQVANVTCRPRIMPNPKVPQSSTGALFKRPAFPWLPLPAHNNDYTLRTLGTVTNTETWHPCNTADYDAGEYTGAEDGLPDGFYGLLYNGLIFTIHNQDWIDAGAEISIVLLSSRFQRKIHGDEHYLKFIDTTFDDYPMGGQRGKNHSLRGGGYDQRLPFNYYWIHDDIDDDYQLNEESFRYIRDGAASPLPYGGGSVRVEGYPQYRYGQRFKTLVSKAMSGAGRNEDAYGTIEVLRDGSPEGTDCEGDGSAEASTIQDGYEDYTERVCTGPSEGDPSCDISTLQQGSPSLEVETECRNVMYVTEEGTITPNPLTVDGKLSNITDVNFISTSGDDSYVITYAGLASGMTVGQHLVSRTSRDPKDNKTIGFHVDYKDEKDTIDLDTGQKKDRMFISAYDDDTSPAGALTVMRSTDPGFVGINDIIGLSEIVLPETIFNIQSTGDAVTRIASLNSSHKASVQLLNPSNDLDYGFEIEYSQSTARADMSIFDNLNKVTVISVDRDTQKVGIHTVTPNELLTLSSGVTGKATLSIEEQLVDPTSTADFGKVYVKPIPDNASQCQSLYFEDDCGNVFDLIFNPATDYRMVYTDDSCNTYAGKTPDRRDDILSQGQESNTAFGGGALYEITTGDRNTAVGCNAGMNLTTGNDNLFLGYHAGQNVTTGSDNIILGYHLASCGDNSQSTIIIGKDLVPGDCGDYEFRLGYHDPLLYGKLGPDFGDRHLYMHRGASFSLESNDQTDLLTMRPKTIVGGVESWFEKVESVGNDYPVGTIDFVFTSKETNGTAIMTEKKLLTLSHDAAAMTNSCSHQVSSPARPIALLKGDLNIQGTLNFCDGTSLASSSGLVYAPGSGINSSVNTATGNTEFNLDIEELVFAGSLSGPDTHLAVSTDNILRKVNIDGLAAIIASGEARITECDDGAGQNHVFTNNSTIDDTTCYTNFFGHRAGDKASNSDFTNFIGAQAGAHEESVPANAVDSCSYSTFIGYRTGWETQNADHSVFIGSSAGYQADNSRVSVFIGDSAGKSANSSRSIGIGDNALEEVVGQKNIELTVGMGGGDPARLIVGTQDYKLNVGDCIGGDMSFKRVSIGDARVDPDAVLEVKALTDDVRLQEWKDHNNNVVAYIDKDGKLYVNGGVVYSA